MRQSCILSPRELSPTNSLTPDQIGEEIVQNYNMEFTNTDGDGAEEIENTNQPEAGAEPIPEGEEGVRVPAHLYVCGIGRATHQHNMMAKSALQYIMMASIIAGGSASNTLSPESPMVDDDFTGKFESYQDGIIAVYDLHFNYFDGYLRFEYIFAGMVVYILITGFYFCMVFARSCLHIFVVRKLRSCNLARFPIWIPLHMLVSLHIWILLHLSFV